MKYLANRLTIALACSAAVFAAHAETFYDNARVRSVQPQYESVNLPREDCRAEWVTQPQYISSSETNPGGVIVGALVGGLLGNQVGRGHGRQAATAVGAVTGAMVGNHIAGGYGTSYAVQTAPQQVTRCQTVNEVQSQIAGYRVVYDYRGQSYTTLLRDNPGPNLQVRVSVEPVVQ